MIEGQEQGDGSGGKRDAHEPSAHRRTPAATGQACSPDQGGGHDELQDQALHAPDCSQDGMIPC